MLLVGDIGGTKIDQVVIDSGADPRAPVARAQLPSADIPSLEAAVRAFPVGVAGPHERACFAVAGPVLGGRAHITNLPGCWRKRRWRARLVSQRSPSSTIWRRSRGRYPCWSRTTRTR